MIRFQPTSLSKGYSISYFFTLPQGGDFVKDGKSVMRFRALLTFGGKLMNGKIGPF
jgi:hypothetical protein